MKILAIETSADETALAILDITGNANAPKIKILSEAVASQIALHAQYGGIFPMMAKRDHSRNIVPLFSGLLKKAKMFREISNNQPASPAGRFPISKEKQITKILDREQELLPQFLKEVSKIKIPKIDHIVVTSGPGLEPALWVGINFAQALGFAWGIPVTPINHMEGHILSILIQESKVMANSKLPITKQKIYKKDTREYKTPKIQFPTLALLVSGGHTELVLMKDWMKYKKIGQTRDDAAGEAFDKVARMLGLPYPGGPVISKLAEQFRNQLKIKNEKLKITLPRPMMYSGDFDFSFSGLKTAVLYLLREIKDRTDEITKEVAHEFENAVVDVLVHKALKAAEKYKVRTIIVGGGVASNTHLRSTLTAKSSALNIPVYFPTKGLSTDNAVMIGIAGYFQILNKKNPPLSRRINQVIRNKKIVAKGNLSL